MIDEKSPSQEVSADEIIHQQEFGVRLREAREYRGLSIRDVAEQLNLNEDVLKSLESSSLEKLPAPTFTQGYIRSYARMLKLPVDEILHAYNLAVPEKENPLVANYGMPIQTAEESSLIKSFLFLILLLLLGALGYFALNSGLQMEEDSTGLVTDSTTDAVLPEVIIENDSLVSAETTEIIESHQESAESEVNQTVEDEIIDPVVTPPVLVSSKSESPTLNASASQPEELQQQTVTAVEGSDVLEISTSSASWAEVQDV
ncbi:MAG: helix-turn-helix domain-containing protein, partial [Gammaproteobacteria bacterium]|nr:helix-turn-helix domain-containing protein [Gammaproteobacteria bacterium]